MMKSFKTEIQSKKILLIFLLSLLFFVFGTVIQFRKSANSTNNDFLVYYKTSERISNSHWEDIYTRKDGAFPYRYIPYSLMTVSWLDHFTEIGARKLWVVLQATAFAAGFYYVYQTLILMESQWPLLAVSVAMLLSFRQFIDSLYSGQIAGIIFLSFSLGQYFFLKKKSVMDGAANSVATSLKIFPGILLIHGLIKAEGREKKMHFLFSGVLLFVVFNILFMTWIHFFHPEANPGRLWHNWVEICRADSEYFDGSTPKSQSLRAFMLRVFGKSDKVEILWRYITLAGIGALILYWIKNKTVTAFEKGYSYCLGIMAFIFFMPESLPYQMVNVAIPLAVIIAHPQMKTSILHKILLGLFAVCICFASSDFIGRTPSDIVQSWSVPFFIMCFLTFLLFKKHQVVKI